MPVRFCFSLLLVLSCCTCVRAQYETLRDLPYRPDNTDEYARERCKLDIYYPTDSAGFATIVYFHGGGLEFGAKHFLEQWEEQGIAVVSANYRLHPKVENPVYTQDAAAAVAWTMQNIDRYGGDPGRIYVSGHSAGGYLASMIGMDDVVVDRYAPIHHLRVSPLPIALITGDRELELFGRYEETAYFWRMLVASGHQHAYLYELDGFGHGPMLAPAAHLTLELIRQWEKSN